MTKVVDLFSKKESKAEEDATEKYLTELNQLLAPKIVEAVKDMESALSHRKVAIEGVLGSGIVDFVTASILIYHAAHYLNRLCGHDIKIESERLKLQFKEVEQLSTVLLQRLMKVERQRFEENVYTFLKKSSLFRRLKKKAYEGQN